MGTVTSTVFRKAGTFILCLIGIKEVKVCLENIPHSIAPLLPA